MALTTEEKQIVEYGKAQGKTKEQVLAALASYRQKAPPVKPSPLKETALDARDTFLNAGRRLNQAGEEIVAKATDTTSSIPDRIVGAGSSLFKGIGRFIGGGAVDIAKTVLPQRAEDAISGAAQKGGEALAKTDFVQDIVSRYNALPPETKKGVDNALGYAEGLAEIATGGATSRVARTAVDTTTRTAQATQRSITSLFSRPSKSVDEVVEQADTALGKTRATAEAEAPDLSIKEKWVGLQPDIKKRIAGKQDKLQAYFDVAHARNADDTLPTAYEYGSRQAQTAVDTMETLLNETGGKIGATRKKLGTYQAPIQEVQRIEQSFAAQLAKLNLEIAGKAVRQRGGTVAKTGSTNDIRIINEIYQDLLTVKQSPTLTNLIDLRSALDTRINFAKSAREASSSVDPLARQVRKELADTAARIVGKSEAAELQRYSDFMDAYNDLRSFTDRRAGGEYLLRLVLSGRGGEARQIIQTIKDYTGIDLMDDATMMTLATDFIGSTSQKNLFRQEIMKAGLDATALLKGDVKGLLGTILQKGIDKIVDPEEVLLDAAK